MNATRSLLILFILFPSFIVSHEVHAASAARAWYAPIAKGVRICASSYKTWRMVHPRLATTSDLVVLAGTLVWALGRFIKLPANDLRQEGSQERFFYPDDQQSNDPCLAPDRTQYEVDSDEALTRGIFKPEPL